MLDHEHRAVGGHLLDQCRDPFHVFVRHARRRLVEQHHLRVEREGGRDFERALAPVRQLDRGRRRKTRETDSVDQFLGAVVEHRKRTRRAPELERPTPLALECDAHVLEHRQMRKRGGDLKRAHHAHARNRSGRRAGDLAAVEEDLTGRRGEEMREQVEAGCLPGTVGTDQRVDRPPPNFEIDAVDGDETLELLGEPARLQNDIVGHAAPDGRCRRCLL